MPLEAVLLDFGGTLDSDGLHWSTQFALSFEASGVSVERGALDQAFLISDRALMQSPVIQDLGFEDQVKLQVGHMLDTLNLKSEVRIQEITQHFMRRALGHLDQSVALLKAFHRYFRFGLVSNFTSNLPLILAQVGLTEVLDCVICSEQVGCQKPDPEIFRLALAGLKVSPEQAAMIGDSLVSDIMPAKTLGLTTLWLRGDRVFGKGDPTAADQVVTSLTQALEICASKKGCLPIGAGA